MNFWLVMVLAATPARSVDGGLTEAEIADVVELRAADFTRCFETAKQRKKASVKYRFEVNDGRVTRFEFLDSSALESDGATCVGAALEKTEFPSREDGATVVDWTFAAPSASRVVEAKTATLAQLAPFDEHLIGCYTQAPRNEKIEGTITLDLAVLRSGEIVAASVIDQSEALERIHLDGCLQGRLIGARFESAPRARHIRAGWILATSEHHAKLLAVPSERRREIVPDPKAFVPGGLDKDVILRVIHKDDEQVRHCYESALRKNHALEGKVAVAWKIGADGTVSSASVTEDTMGEPSVASCVLERVKTWTFPRPQGGGFVDVTFPWIFKPAGN